MRKALVLAALLPTLATAQLFDGPPTEQRVLRDDECYVERQRYPDEGRPDSRVMQIPLSELTFHRQCNLHPIVEGGTRRGAVIYFLLNRGNISVEHNTAEISEFFDQNDGRLFLVANILSVPDGTFVQQLLIPTCEPDVPCDVLDTYTGERFSMERNERGRAWLIETR